MIHYRYSAVLALAALLPANQVGNLAARVDVQSISPNRWMARATSALESVTSTALLHSTNTTSSTNVSQITGVSGNGIGIAVLARVSRATR